MEMCGAIEFIQRAIACNMVEAHTILVFKRLFESHTNLQLMERPRVKGIQLLYVPTMEQLHF